MKTLIFVITSGVILAIAATLFLKNRLKDPVDKGNLQSSVNSEVKKMLKDTKSHGVVVGVYKNGRTRIKGYGAIEKGSDQAPDEHTVFQIASVTKVFTAALLQTLHHKGVVDIDANLKELIGESVALNQRAGKITLRQLVTHTSGLPRIPKSLARLAEDQAGDSDIMVDPYSFVGTDEFFAYLSSADDIKKSGKFAYSNYGVGLLGHVLERVTDSSLEQLLLSELFEPLGMKDSGMTGKEVSSEVQSAKAQGYTAKGAEAEFWTFASCEAAGGMYSTAEDMMKFIIASLEPNHFANDLLNTMRVPQFKGTTGLGWMQPGFIEKILNNKDWIWHNGLVGGYASYIGIDPIAQSGVIVLSAKAIDTTMLGVMIARNVRTQSWK